MEWSVVLENASSIAILVAGLAVLIALALGWPVSQRAVNSVVIALLCLFAVSEILQRTGKLERIERGIEDLQRARDGEFTEDIEYGWAKAADMISSVGPGGEIYDTTSIRNKPEYEALIASKAQQGVRITRVVCSDDVEESLASYIQAPPSGSLKGCEEQIRIRHLPYPLPVDILVTREKASIRAILGVRVAKADEDVYSSVFYILNPEFADEVLSMYQNIILPMAHDHCREGETGECKLCQEIVKLYR